MGTHTAKAVLVGLLLLGVAGTALLLFRGHPDIFVLPAEILVERVRSPPEGHSINLSDNDRARSHLLDIVLENPPNMGEKKLLNTTEAEAEGLRQILAAKYEASYGTVLFPYTATYDNLTLTFVIPASSPPPSAPQ